jgi:hypothetical protein
VVSRDAEKGATMTVLPKTFRPVYRYVMKNHRPQEEKLLDEKLWHQSGVVYARIYRGKIVYIGVTDKVLSGRIGAHLRGIGKSKQKGAKRYRKWAEGKRITIFAYTPAPVKLLDREIKIHRAVEAALIEEFRRPHAKDWFVDRT